MKDAVSVVAALVLVLGAVLACGGSGASAVFKPKSPKKTYEPLVRSATKLPNISSINECGADEIGVVHAEGTPSEVVEALAVEAADNGGTHFVVRGDNTASSEHFEGSAQTIAGTTYMSGQRVTEKSRQTWAVVYRLGKESWGCADFNPHGVR